MAVLSKCDYIYSNDVILKSSWCDYVQKHSYEQQGRFRYVCENTTPLIKPTANITSSYQSGNSFCVVLETNTIGNIFTLVYGNGYTKEVTTTSLTTTICVEYTRIGDNGAVTITPEDSTGIVGTDATATYDKLEVSIPFLFYPLTRKLWGEISANQDSDIEIWVNNVKIDSYNTGTSNMTRYFHSTILTSNVGDLTVKATKKGVTVETKRAFNKQDWNKIKITPTTTKITHTESNNEIKISMSSTITSSYFDGLDYPNSIDKIGVK